MFCLSFCISFCLFVAGIFLTKASQIHFEYLITLICYKHDIKYFTLVTLYIHTQQVQCFCIHSHLFKSHFFWFCVLLYISCGPFDDSSMFCVFKQSFLFILVTNTLFKHLFILFIVLSLVLPSTFPFQEAQGVCRWSMTVGCRTHTHSHLSCSHVEVHDSFQMQ